MLNFTLTERENLIFSPFSHEIKHMLFHSNRALKSVLIQGVSAPETGSKKSGTTLKKYAEAVSEIDSIKKYLSHNLDKNLAKIGHLLENFTPEEQKVMTNQKKEYRIFVSKVQKNLKRVKIQLNQHLHG